MTNYNALVKDRNYSIIQGKSIMEVAMYLAKYIDPVEAARPDGFRPYHTDSTTVVLDQVNNFSLVDKDGRFVIMYRYDDINKTTVSTLLCYLLRIRNELREQDLTFVH